MADSQRRTSGDFAKKVQRQLSRGKEKVLQKLGKTVETRDDQFECCLQQFIDQQTDGNRIYKDMRNYVSAVRDMREASRRLSQSLFDAYDPSWVGEEDLGAIVEGEDLLWNDYEVKLLDQAVRAMESYVGQFPDVREKISKRGRKLVDYDSSRHHLEALQTAKKRDDIKIRKAEEEVNAAKSVYENINSELKEELPVLFDNRVGCYISVFSSMSNLQNIFFKEMHTFTQDLQNVMKELQLQHPDKVLAVRGLQRFGSLKRRSLMSPKAWKTSFSEFHWNYNPRSSLRSSFRSPEKPRHSTLPRESSSIMGSSHHSMLEISESRDQDTELNHSEMQSPPRDGEKGPEAAGGDSKQNEEEERSVKKEESEPSAERDEKALPSESSSEENVSCDSESLEQQLSAVAAADSGLLHIDESDGSLEDLNVPKENGLGNVPGMKDLSGPHKDVPVENQASLDTKSTTQRSTSD
ncbi:hypothetical protein fugu_007004 [Takifugu bimaculatus]|uniref:BAR domain-containing protein n=1 Tax=Takifugu bimaculatus TaxID=433685 RepID=A0A4Z2B323_9TELE|nr:hypothetical protein fugu_007004 [Takifugu bimaculatus]